MVTGNDQFQQTLRLKLWPMNRDHEDLEEDR